MFVLPSLRMRPGAVRRRRAVRRRWRRGIVVHPWEDHREAEIEFDSRPEVAQRIVPQRTAGHPAIGAGDADFTPRSANVDQSRALAPVEVVDDVRRPGRPAVNRRSMIDDGRKRCSGRGHGDHRSQAQSHCKFGFHRHSISFLTPCQRNSLGDDSVPALAKLKSPRSYPVHRCGNRTAKQGGGPLPRPYDRSGREQARPCDICGPDKRGG